MDGSNDGQAIQSVRGDSKEATKDFEKEVSLRLRNTRTAISFKTNSGDTCKLPKVTVLDYLNRKLKRFQKCYNMICEEGLYLFDAALLLEGILATSIMIDFIQNEQNDSIKFAKVDTSSTISVVVSRFGWDLAKRFTTATMLCTVIEELVERG